MHKTKIDGLIWGLAQGRSKYKINNVNFIVESRFEPIDSDTTNKEILAEQKRAEAELQKSIARNDTVAKLYDKPLRG